jgi:replicative DNA helicase
MSTHTSNLNATELERAILGIMMVSDHGLRDGIKLLSGGEAMFTQHAHRAIFRAIQQLFAEGLAVDNISVNQRMALNGSLKAVRGETSVTEIYAKAPRGQNIETYCKFLISAHAKRQSLEVAHILQSGAASEEGDVQELLATVQSLLSNVQNGLAINRPKRVGELYDEVVDSIVHATKQPNGLTGVTSGLEAVNRLTGGWQGGDLVIIAARPGMGKTSWALFMAGEAAHAGKPGLFFSLEMKDDQLVRKMISTELGVYTTSQLQRGRKITTSEAESIRTRAARLRNAPLFIDQTPAISIGELRAKAAQYKAEHDIAFIVVDYLQLMTGDQGKGREAEIASISRALKQTAKELNIPVLALAQLSRAVEIRGGDKKPMLSDLRESGAIEQDADIVVFPYRPEYYGITQNAEGMPVKDLTELIFAKHRNGSVAEIQVGSTMCNGRYFDIGGVVQVVEPGGSLSTELRPMRTAEPSEFDDNHGDYHNPVG